MAKRLSTMIAEYEQGSKFVPNADPSAYIQYREWPITLSFNATTTSIFTAKSIHAEIMESLPAGFVAAFEFKVKEVRIWGLQNQAIQLTAIDHLRGNNRYHISTDYGSPTRFSRAGFRYGTTSRIFYHNQNGGLDFIFMVEGDFDDEKTVLCQIDLLIKPTDLPKKPESVGVDEETDTLTVTHPSMTSRGCALS